MMNGHVKSLLSIVNRIEGSVCQGAEIGVAFAENAIVMLRALPDLHLYLIDDYNENYKWPEKHGIPPRYTIQDAKKIAVKSIKPFKDRTTWILQPSIEAAKLVVDESLDYAFIDADHTYRAVKEDIQAWLPKIRAGGILAGHDYGKNYEGVRLAVDEYFGDLVKVHYITWWVFVSEVREAA